MTCLLELLAAVMLLAMIERRARRHAERFMPEGWLLGKQRTGWRL